MYKVCVCARGVCLRGLFVCQGYFLTVTSVTDIFLLWQSRAVALNHNDTIPHYLVIIAFGKRSVYNNKLFRKMDNSTWAQPL